MGKAIFGKLFRLVFLPCVCILGCLALDSSPAPEKVQPDPLVVELLKVASQGKPPTTPLQQPEAMLKVVPLQTPLEEARAVMEKHHFKCWGGVPGTYGTCLHCTAYRQKNQWVADRLVVKLYYNRNRIVYEEVTAEYLVDHPTHSFWPSF